MAVKYDGGIILGADARSANVRLVNYWLNFIGLTKFSIKF